MPFFKLDEMPGAVIAPGIAGRELEVGYYTQSGESEIWRLTSDV
jgi:hypothetical protein